MLYHDHGPNMYCKLNLFYVLYIHILFPDILANFAGAKNRVGQRVDAWCCDHGVWHRQMRSWARELECTVLAVHEVMNLQFTPGSSKGCFSWLDHKGCRKTPFFLGFKKHPNWKMLAGKFPWRVDSLFSKRGVTDIPLSKQPPNVGSFGFVIWVFFKPHSIVPCHGAKERVAERWNKLSNGHPLLVNLPPPEQQGHKIQWSLQNPPILAPPPINLEVQWL